MSVTNYGASDMNKYYCFWYRICF